ncbi:nuclease-related domain-containing protein [Aeromicrobium sp. 179-A 4D2 NHS]|uniref:nuclease-related domain-containing protein n=1 Tax=Aeromicrobium sp. 179-A 4D2 NHS TaxID=3142375 RepID=UPI0039A349C3
MAEPRKGRVVGKAGGSLDQFSTWGQGDGSAAKRGKQGEIRTARLLDELASRDGGPSILHDLRIPMKGVSANIDHVVVSGRRVLLLDTKEWKPGFYWTFRGRSYRGRDRVPHAEKKTMEMASKAVRGFLEREGVKATVVHPVVAVWPSSNKKTLNVWALRFPGARVIHADGLGRAVGRVLNSRPWKKWANDNADDDVVNALAKLLY